MSIEEIIERLAVIAGQEKYIENSCDDKLRRERAKRNVSAIRAAASLLRAHPEAQPNEPLTKKQLQFMSGDPVWIVRMDGADRWALIRYGNSGGIGTYGCGFLAWEDLGKTWFPYRRPPKED